MASEATSRSDYTRTTVAFVCLVKRGERLEPQSQDVRDVGWGLWAKVCTHNGVQVRLKEEQEALVVRTVMNLSRDGR